MGLYPPFSFLTNAAALFGFEDGCHGFGVGDLTIHDALYHCVEGDALDAQKFVLIRVRGVKKSDPGQDKDTVFL